MCSIGLEINLTQFGFWLNSVELNPEVEFDWMQLSSISKHLIGYARLPFNYKFIDSEGMVTRRNYAAAEKVACL